jgi:hypothetical protein
LDVQETSTKAKMTDEKPDKKKHEPRRPGGKTKRGDNKWNPNTAYGRIEKLIRIIAIVAIVAIGLFLLFQMLNRDVLHQL